MNVLTRLATDVCLMLRRPPRQQYAALCYRRKKGLTEVLLLTSRDTGRWVIPKGWPMDGKKAHAVAAQEAFEEAGVRGNVDKNHFGFFDYDKKLRNGVKVVCRVQVHLLEVTDLVKNFPERESRTLEWVTPVEASHRVNEPELKELFLSFDQQMAQTQQRPAQKNVNL
ncbi:putative NTP pyrophosphohydrolase [Agrobacterium sp. DSM 25558]|uniref:NUDIX hydrolase n=1 Tax=Agrobacterium sp. DSM 25558 TaxID=1907665 RepID=UPI0009724F31|nr:NUDIX hydrolase [Agrobacterium sp. DSM 25558]SCX04618.1 putative NTP pyrophosphohydrolase [Agrobacterium sp. DSM 25558]